MVTKIHKPSKFARFVLYPITGLIFLFLLIVVLTYASGYRIDKKDGKWTLQKTGILIVATRPGEAKITLNNKATKKLTSFPFLPVKINNLLPTTYKLVLSREGYRTWENNVKVEANFVTWVNYVLLFPTDLKISNVEPLQGKNVIAQSKNNRYLLVSGQEAGVNSYYQFDVTNNNIEKVWPKQTPPTEPYLINPIIQEAKFTENNERVILKVQKDASFDFALLDLNSTEGKITSLGAFYNNSFDRIDIDPVDSNHVFALSKGSLYRLDLSNSAVPAPIALKVVDFSPERNRSVYYVESGSSLKQVSFDGSRKETIENSVVVNNNYKLSYSSQENVLLFMPRDEKTLKAYFRVNNQMSTLELEKNITDFKWSPDGRYILYYSGNKVYHYDWDRQKETSSVLADNIQSINWFFDENHFLVRGEKELYEIDFDNTNKVTFSNTPAVFYQDPRLTSLIFLENNIFKKFTGSF